MASFAANLSEKLMHLRPPTVHLLYSNHLCKSCKLRSITPWCTNFLVAKSESFQRNLSELFNITLIEIKFLHLEYKKRDGFHDN